MKEKKDFLPFLKNGHQFISKKRSLVYNHSIIKGKKIPSESRIQKVQWSDIHESGPEIRIIENQGTIEAIRIRCRCGCDTTLKLEYEEGSSENLLN